MKSVSIYCDNELKNLKLNNTHIETLLYENFGSISNMINKLHNIYPRIDGCAMEAFITFAYGNNDSLSIASDDNKLQNNIFDLLESIIKSETNYSAHYIKCFRVLFIRYIETPQFPYYLDKSVDCPDEFIVFYIGAYIIKHFYKAKDIWGSEKWKQYMTEFIKNIKDIKDYIFSIPKSFPINPSFQVHCEFTHENQKLEGYCDILTDDWIIDVKCSKDNYINDWHKQLNLYNIAFNKKNIGIINILENKFLIFLQSNL